MHFAERWRPRRSIMFCSWGAEEYGLIGSSEWAEVTVPRFLCLLLFTSSHFVSPHILNISLLPVTFLFFFCAIIVMSKLIVTFFGIEKYGLKKRVTLYFLSVHLSASRNNSARVPVCVYIYVCKIR